MKFKAKLSLEHTQLLYNLILPLSKLNSTSTQTSSNLNAHDDSTNRKSILFLDDNRLVLSTRGSPQKADSEGIFSFAELVTKDGIFHNHVIDSVEHDNAILMEVCLGQFKTALKGVLNTQREAAAAGGMASTLVSQGMHEVSIKLAKRNGGLPHLCFDIKDATYMSIGGTRARNGNSGNTTSGIGVNYSVPVRIMRVDELQYNVPPRLGMPDLQLELPRDRPLKNVVERLRGIAPQVYLEGCMQKGILTLRMDSDGASVRTSFNKLVPIHEDCKSSQTPRQTQTETEQSQDREHGSNEQQQETTHRTQTQMQTQTQNNSKCTVKVDSRKLYTSLHWQASLGIKDVSTAILCMWENEMLVLDVTLNPEIGRFMYYVPCQYVSADEL